MSEKIIQNRIGKTPLVEVRSLEEYLGISKIYLKLEGNNPSGHREDRLAYLIIKEALSKGKDTICIGTYGIVAGSLAFLSQFFDVRCVFYTPDKDKIMRKDLIGESSEIIEFGDTYEECINESRRVAEANGWFNANAGLENNVMNMCAFSIMANEIFKKTRMNVDTIFSQTSNGSSISGLQLGIKQLWLENKLKKTPAIYAVSTAHGNAIVSSFEKNLDRFQPIREDSEINPTEYSMHLINRYSQNGQDALNAISESGGKALGITEEELIKYYNIINENLEGLHLSIYHAYPLAAFIKEVECGNIKEGNHVIILNDGMVDIDIRPVSDKDDLPLPYNQLVEKTHHWLLGYKDPIIEIEEAVENALDKGFLLCAYQDNELVGITVIVNFGFEHFATSYHLAYIATNSKVKGMGIATQLLNEAIELTEGDLSLHVDLDNEGAIKLYEKMGFKKPYYRMIHQNKSH